MRTITIGQNDAGQRLDKFLQKCLPSLPKSLLYKSIRKKRIKYNGGRCKGMEILTEGDILTLYINDEFFEKNVDTSFSSSSGSLSIAYEDEKILVVCKPSGQFAHGKEDSLIDNIKKYLFEQGEYDPSLEQSFSPALCNRIDRNTEGLVIAAKTAEALRTMNEAIRRRIVHKSYLAITSSPLPKQSDTCTAWLKKDKHKNQVQVRSSAPDRSWQKICTRYRVLAQKGKMQLVSIDLLTGRTHQIRAHLSFLGAPLLGDPKYGSSSHSKEENQCLCAYALHFQGLQDTCLSALENVQVHAERPSFVTTYFPEIPEETLYPLQKHCAFPVLPPSEA